MGFLLRTALLLLTTAANLNNSSNLTSHISSTNMDNLNHPEVGQCVDNGCSQEFDGFGVCIDFSLKDVDFATLAQRYRMSANSPPGKCGHHSNDNCCHCLRSEEPPKALALIVIGGDTETGATTSVEVEGNHAKPIPDLLEARWGLSAFVVPGSQDLLVCGGKGRHHDPRTAMTCDTFTSPAWQAKTHNLQQPRIYATSVTVESGDIFLMGGWYSSTTSEVLAKGATTWAKGPTLKHEISGACAVSLDAGSQGFAVIGGGSDHKQVSVYKDNEWKEDWGPLEEGRKGHGCVRISNLIFVAGGYSFTYHTYSDTTIVLDTQSMITQKIKMIVARAYFSIQAVHGGIMALGGLTGDPSEPFTRTVEKWTPETAVWSPCPDIQLDVGRSAFASVLMLDTTTTTPTTSTTTTTITSTTTTTTSTTTSTTTTTTPTDTTKKPDCVQLETTGYNYKYFPWASSVVNFEVRSKGQVHVVLAPTETDGTSRNDVYEIVISGWDNNKSVIRKGMQKAEEVKFMATLLNAAEFRKFWITGEAINNGFEIKVGISGEDAFMSWTDTNDPLEWNFLGLSGWSGADAAFMNVCDG